MQHLSKTNRELLDKLAAAKGPDMLQRLIAHLERAEAAPSYLDALNTSLNKERKRVGAKATLSDYNIDVAQIVPPVNAIFYTDAKPGIVFTQHNLIFIEGVNVNTSSFTDEELALFWWQPLTEPRLIEVLQPLAKMLQHWADYKFSWTLGSYSAIAQTTVRDIHPAIVAAGLEQVVDPSVV